MAPDAPDDANARALAGIVAAEFRLRLLGEQLPRIRKCVELLGDNGVWQRPAAHCNSVGNLLLHLAGNTTQWIVASLGGEPDRRDRPAEFAAAGGVPAGELVDRLEAVWRRACDLVERATIADLLRVRTIQQRYEVSALAAVLHVLEHCSGHAGQIYAWTKQATGRDLRFYDL